MMNIKLLYNVESKETVFIKDSKESHKGHEGHEGHEAHSNEQMVKLSCC